MPRFCFPRLSSIFSGAHWFSWQSITFHRLLSQIAIRSMLSYYWSHDMIDVAMVAFSFGRIHHKILLMTMQLPFLCVGQTFFVELAVTLKVSKFSGKLCQWHFYCIEILFEKFKCQNVPLNLFCFQKTIHPIRCTNFENVQFSAFEYSRWNYWWKKMALSFLLYKISFKLKYNEIWIKFVNWKSRPSWNCEEEVLE